MTDGGNKSRNQTGELNKMVNKEFFAALADLVKEKGISEEAFL